MTLEDWQARTAAKATRALERRKLEAHFNSEIIRRHQAGEAKEEIISDLRITRELFNRVMRSCLHGQAAD